MYVHATYKQLHPDFISNSKIEQMPISWLSQRTASLSEIRFIQWLISEKVRPRLCELLSTNLEKRTCCQQKPPSTIDKVGTGCNWNIYKWWAMIWKKALLLSQ